MSRIAATFSNLKSQGKKALIPFITAGDPQSDKTVPLMHRLVEAGANIIELGVPFSDPMADGPTIQRASERALKHGVSLRDVIGMVVEFRKKDTLTPVVLMGYANPIEAMGYEPFAAAAAAAGVDGVLTVDYPPRGERYLRGAPWSPWYRSDLPAVADHAGSAHGAGWQAGTWLHLLCFAQGSDGFGYSRHRRGGEENPADPGGSQLACGYRFWHSDGQAARTMSQIADAVVIGSRIVKKSRIRRPNPCWIMFTTW